MIKPHLLLAVVLALGMYQAKAQPKGGPATSTKSASLTTDHADENINALEMKMKILQAEIKKQTDEYEKRPRKRFIGNRTQLSEAETSYLTLFQEKIQRIAATNYPEEVKRRKLYGSVILNISIKADGSLNLLEIRRSSGSQTLDMAAFSVVRQAAPFQPFPPEIQKAADILVIPRMITFAPPEEQDNSTEIKTRSDPDDARKPLMSVETIDSP